RRSGSRRALRRAARRWQARVLPERTVLARSAAGRARTAEPDGLVRTPQLNGAQRLASACVARALSSTLMAEATKPATSDTLLGMMRVLLVLARLPKALM